MKISVVIEKDENGYYVFAPELPGCQSQGRTFEEAEANIKEAIELYLETMDTEEREAIGSIARERSVSCCPSMPVISCIPR